MKTGYRFGFQAAIMAGLAMLLTACAGGKEMAVYPPADNAIFEADRQAILAMAGNYRVGFNFQETLALHDGYELKEPYKARAEEIVRVIEDTGNFISLQHILVVGGDEKYPVKHWRQDWIYEPDSLLEYKGHNLWQSRDLAENERRGAWSQSVWQVDDSPRYAGVGKWIHANGNSTWTSGESWRPLPRRDYTKRDDYDVLVAVNRHTITPTGWSHEQDNAKLVLRDGKSYYLTRELGVNTYDKFDGFATAVADNYWRQTADYWRTVRADWAGIKRQNRSFRIARERDGKALWEHISGLAGDIARGEKSPDRAGDEAEIILSDYVSKSESM